MLTIARRYARSEAAEFEQAYEAPAQTGSAQLRQLDALDVDCDTTTGTIKDGLRKRWEDDKL